MFFLIFIIYSFLYSAKLFFAVKIKYMDGIEITGYVFLGIFFSFSIFHLIVCFIEKEKLRKITKIFCLVLLAIAACFLAYRHPLIYVGAILGAVGDYFLLKKNHLLSFVFGVISFFIGHVLYLTQIIFLFDWPNYGYAIFYGSLIIFLVIFSIALYPKTKLLAGKVAYLGNAYYGVMFVNCVVSIVLACMTSYHWQLSLFAIGYVFFVTSDSFLLYTSYIKDVKRRDFYIMLSYLVAQSLIVLSLVFINIGI